MIGYIWTRESNRFDKERYSIKSQLDACRDAAAADNIPVAREFVVQFSGVDLWKIPELTELREIVKQTAGPKRIYCYSQDRLARGEEGPEIFWLLFELRRAGAEVVILKNPVDLKNIAGQIMTLIAGHEAAGEIGKIKDRTMRGKRRRVQDGKLWNLGRDKFGYRKNRELGIAEIDETQADTIRRLFREADAGKGLLTIAKDLNRDGVSTSFARRGEKRSQWHPATVRVLLRDPAYKGEVWAYRHSENPLRMPDNLFPPIVDTALWDRVQKRLDANRGEHSRNQKRPALLRGLIFCAVCGSRLYLAKQHGLYYYRCASEFLRRHENGFTVCQGKSARADRIEKEVWARFLRLVNKPGELITALGLERNAGALEGLQARMGVVTAQIKQKETEQERLVKRLRQAGGRVAVLIEGEIRQIETERAGLQNEAAEIQSQLQAQQSWRLDVNLVYEKCHRLAAEMAGEPTFDERRRTLEEFHVTILANGLKWQFALSSSK